MPLNRDDISTRLAAVGYVADRDIATALWLMDFLKRPLLLEGEAGVGKTEVGKGLAAVPDAELIRLRCYAALAVQVARRVAEIRKEALRKVPGVAETLDWAATLAGLDVHDLRQEPETVHETMICLLKTHEDRARLTREVSDRLVGKVA